MNALNSFLNFIKQAEEVSEVSQEEPQEEEVSLSDKHQYYKDAYQKFLSVQESLDKLVSTKEKEDPAYDKYADPAYADKAKEISAGLEIVEAEAKKIGTILPSHLKESQNV